MKGQFIASDHVVTSYIKSLRLEKYFDNLWNYMDSVTNY